jgi:alkanesulfonate monooxygenase SsuD/methylene tetrahydromethanopterin reductase-like flavin-dependent oxidoreductase (luciferase family)
VTIQRVGFLTFGHYQSRPGSAVPTAREALVQTIELAIVAEELGLNGAYLRVHHFARQQSSPFPVLAAIAARTQRIEMGTAVIDMRYENPLYMAEEAAQTDLIANGRLQLGVSRGSPEPALNGPETFGYVPDEGETQADMARRHLELFRQAISGTAVANSDPQMTGGRSIPLPIHPQSSGLSQRIWWGSGTRATARWSGEQGLNLMSSTLLNEDTGIPFDELQAEQIAIFRQAWKDAGWKHEPRISISRSVLPIVNDLDEQIFGQERYSSEQVGSMLEPEHPRVRFGKSYAGEPDVIAAQLAQDAAIHEADTLLITIPNTLGVDYNTHLMSTIVEHVLPVLGWQKNT